MKMQGMAVAMFGLAALLVALPPTAMATEGADETIPRLVVTTVCTVYLDHLDDAVADIDALLGIGLGGHMSECEVTTEYVGAAPAPPVAVNIPDGALFPACADDLGCFDPYAVEVDAGTEVVWTNSDTVLHTVTDPDGAFDGWLLPGEEFAFTFDTPGTYTYGCTVHPWAGGVVTVGRDATPYYDSKSEKVVGVVQDVIDAYDSLGTAAFAAVNAMESEDAYPFVIDAQTLTVVAEGAFPRTVGLPATFLDDADRPLADILAELTKSEGAWAEYAFHNPKTASYEDKTSYLVLHDGYIFGSGYYTSADARATEAVDTMLNVYGALGENGFADVVSVPTGESIAPFVLDADTLDIVAHADPNVSGGDIRDAMAPNLSIDLVSDMLDEHGSLWASYPSAGPAEYTRAYMLLHDGYVFASGYDIGPQSRIQSLVDEGIRLYEREGDAAFDIITSMHTTTQMVYDLHTSTLLAASSTPAFVGAVVPLSAIGFDRDLEEVLQLYEQGGLWSDRYGDNVDGTELRLSAWSVLHDEHIFLASNTYSPDAAAVAEVGSAIELYKMHGEAAFDRITWQAVDPAIVYPFVFDANTWRTVAHAAFPDRLGLLPASIMADNDLGEISEALAENEYVWVSYKFNNPISGLVEHKRTYLALHDGYIFAAGYYQGNFDQAEGLIADAIADYDADAKAAFEAISSEMSGSLDFAPYVLDHDTLDVVAHGGYPDMVEKNIAEITTNGESLVADIRKNLMEDGDTGLVVSVMLDPRTGFPVAQSVIIQLHDGYVFAVAQPLALYTK